MQLVNDRRGTYIQYVNEILFNSKSDVNQIESCLKSASAIVDADLDSDNNESTI